MYKLLFVYNANSGVVNSLLDSAHKMLHPSSYQCKLCELTFGVTKEVEAWKSFREASPIHMEFLHKNEFLKKYKSKWLPKYEFPIVLEVTQSSLEIVITSQEMEALDSASQLIALLKERMPHR